MDTVTLVTNQIDDGQRLLDRLEEEGFVVRVACWVKPIEEDRWSQWPEWAHYQRSKRPERSPC